MDAESHYRNAGRVAVAKRDFRGAFQTSADINYARTGIRKNLTIMVGNLNDMTFPEKSTGAW